MKNVVCIVCALLLLIGCGSENSKTTSNQTKNETKKATNEAKVDETKKEVKSNETEETEEKHEGEKPEVAEEKRKKIGMFYMMCSLAQPETTNADANRYILNNMPHDIKRLYQYLIDRDDESSEESKRLENLVDFSNDIANELGTFKSTIQTKRFIDIGQQMWQDAKEEKELEGVVNMLSYTLTTQCWALIAETYDKHYNNCEVKRHATPPIITYLVLRVEMYRGDKYYTYEEKINFIRDVLMIVSGNRYSKKTVRDFVWISLAWYASHAK